MNNSHLAKIINLGIFGCYGILIWNRLEFCKDHDNCKKGLPAPSTLGSTGSVVSNIEITTLTLLTSFVFATKLLNVIVYPVGRHTYQLFASFLLPFSMLLCMSYDTRRYPDKHGQLAKLVIAASLATFLKPGLLILLGSVSAMFVIEKNGQKPSLYDINKQCSKHKSMLTKASPYFYSGLILLIGIVSLISNFKLILKKH